MCLFHCLVSTLPHSFRVSVSLLSEILPTKLSKFAKNSALSVSCAPSTDVSGYAPGNSLVLCGIIMPGVSTRRVLCWKKYLKSVYLLLKMYSEHSQQKFPFQFYGAKNQIKG